MLTHPQSSIHKETIQPGEAGCNPSYKLDLDQLRCDHRGVDLSTAVLIPNPSLQSVLSGLIGVLYTD